MHFNSYFNSLLKNLKKCAQHAFLSWMSFLFLSLKFRAHVLISVFLISDIDAVAVAT